MEHDNNKFLESAKTFAAWAINESMETMPKDFYEKHRLNKEDMYIVWFCKTLQNWKALVSTDKVTSDDGVGSYVEVTHNGDKWETYCDVYKKTLNTYYVEV